MEVASRNLRVNDITVDELVEELKAWGSYFEMMKKNPKGFLFYQRCILNIKGIGISPYLFLLGNWVSVLILLKDMRI